MSCFSKSFITSQVALHIWLIQKERDVQGAGSTQKDLFSLAAIGECALVAFVSLAVWMQKACFSTCSYYFGCEDPLRSELKRFYTLAEEQENKCWSLIEKDCENIFHQIYGNDQRSSREARVLWEKQQAFELDYPLERVRPLTYLKCLLQAHKREMENDQGSSKFYKQDVYRAFAYAKIVLKQEEDGDVFWKNMGQFPNAYRELYSLIDDMLQGEEFISWIPRLQEMRRSDIGFVQSWANELLSFMKDPYHCLVLEGCLVPTKIKSNL